MSLIMKLRFRPVILTLTSCLLAGCAGEPPITREALIGSYIYKSRDPEGEASEHEWDRLTLEADGKYDLVQGGPAKARSERTGFWNFTGGDPSQVLLDHAGYPVRVEHGEVRLLIDDDVGIWYAKAR